MNNPLSTQKKEMSRPGNKENTLKHLSKLFGHVSDGTAFVIVVFGKKNICHPI